LKKNLWLIPSAILLGFTPWIYSTAKLFLPITVIALALIWHKDIFKIKKKYLIICSVVFLIITVPFAIDTVFGEGSARFDSISIFNRPTIIGEIGANRVRDTEMGGISASSVLQKVFHNKIIVFGNIFINNYFESLSGDFLFVKGDPSPRQNSSASGGFYIIESVLVLAGLYFLLTKQKEIQNNEKFTILFLLLAGPIPGDLTQDGGNHATRQFLLIFPLIVLASLGMVCVYRILKGKTKLVWASAISVILIWSFFNYVHYFFVHYPWDSEKFWQAGYQEAITLAVSESKKYNEVIISSADEPSLKYFLAWSEYPPSEFQKDGVSHTVSLPGFGSMIEEGKFLFPPVGNSVNLYDLGNVLPENTLYLAPFKELPSDLATNPARLPSNIQLIKIIYYPSGDPAFFLLTKKV
jgi:hypothetical protein